MDRIEIGKKLRMLRGSKSAKDVAHAINISPSALAMYETGKRIPRDDIKSKLSDYYGESVNDLFYA